MCSKIAQKQQGEKSDDIVLFASSRLVGIVKLAKYLQSLLLPRDED
jgi:hypothetical protein